jgi:hypothetical protein
VEPLFLIVPIRSAHHPFSLRMQPMPHSWHYPGLFLFINTVGPIVLISSTSLNCLFLIRLTIFRRQRRFSRAKAILACIKLPQLTFSRSFALLGVQDFGMYRYYSMYYGLCLPAVFRFKILVKRVTSHDRSRTILESVITDVRLKQNRTTEKLMELIA